MRREDRQLLADLAQVNTALPAFAQRVMDNTATPAEHFAVADRVIALGKAIGNRAETLTVIGPEHDDSTGDTSLAATLALSALIDMADALDKSRQSHPDHPADKALPALGVDKLRHK